MGDIKESGEVTSTANDGGAVGGGGNSMIHKATETGGAGGAR